MVHALTWTRSTWYFIFAVALVSGVCACGGTSETQVQVSQTEEDLRALLNVPEHFALPRIPDFNLPTEEKIILGRHLFYDTKLSANQQQSCSSCHFQSLAFADAVQAPQGSTGHQLVRNSQGLGNAVYHATFTWANDGFLNVEDQLQVPLRSDNPVELGVTENHVDEVLARFDTDPNYAYMFSQAFPESDSGASINKIIFALASFVRTMISGNSAYDRYLLGDRDALTSQELQGFQLFNGEKFECFHCHNGINFSVSYIDNNSDLRAISFPFFNNGLYNVDGEGAYPASDQGLYDSTLDPRTRGFFRPQSLRNIALTAPYMHDGSIATLREVIEHYARGGRLTENGPNAGDGRLSPLKSGLVRGFQASEDEIEAVIAFLEALTDEEFISREDLSNPFQEN